MKVPISKEWLLAMALLEKDNDSCEAGVMHPESGYPGEICHDCGTKYGRPKPGDCATYYDGYCGWCGKDTVVTQPRDYNYPPYPVNN